MTTATQRWRVGAITITSIVEDQMAGIPPEFFFPEASAAAVAAHEWCVPDFADADGNVALRVQALVVETGSRQVLIDPCVGNFKHLPLPFWDQQEWSFLERFTAAGFDPLGIDTVVHTHVHFDHIGWDTRLVDGTWVPTFTNARHLFSHDELAFIEVAKDDEMMRDAYRETLTPIMAAGLVDGVDSDADLGDGLRLTPSPGHTPGQVSVWIESEGDRLLVTGDFIHHPVQCSEPAWSEIGDLDATRARQVRHRMLSEAAAGGYRVIGTHFPTRPCGRVVADGDAWRFDPA
jgi:glyoxylase-like metal-dependent hydrolase (beta-lactamase superfamily II)